MYTYMCIYIYIYVWEQAGEHPRKVICTLVCVDGGSSAEKDFGNSMFEQIDSGFAGEKKCGLLNSKGFLSNKAPTIIVNSLHRVMRMGTYPGLLAPPVYPSIHFTRACVI